MLIQGWGPCGIDIEDANDEFWLAKHPNTALAHGKYFVHQRESRTPKFTYDKEEQKKLIGLCADLSRTVFQYV